MRKNLFLLLCLLFVSLTGKGEGPPLIKWNSDFKSYDLKSYLTGIEDTSGEKSIYNLIGREDIFKPISQISASAGVHWLKFSLINPERVEKTLFLTIPFSDSVFLFSSSGSGVKNIEKTGDVVGLNSRSSKTGQLVVLKFSLPAGQHSFYLKLKSISPISQQFKSFTLNGVKLFSEKGYKEAFEDSRIVHAFFYGAIIIMLIYNFIIFLTLRYKSYFSYVLFIFIYIIFLSSNSGYLLELFWPDSTRFDLYLRFFSAPLLIAAYLMFGRIFLETSSYVPKLDKVMKALIAFFILCIAIMFLGNWWIGRKMVTAGAIISFIFILITAFKVYRKGYPPAGYFLLANALLLIGGIIYAGQRFSFLVHTPVSQYAIQASSVIQLALFSIGLADRINLARKEVADQKLALANLEKQQEVEKKALIEEKNKELEVKVKERTYNLEQKNRELLEAEHLIREQNEELATINSGLEEIVQARTKELNVINQELQNSNKELDLFIYRTAHDIRGPLARVLGLCHIGLLEISEEVAIDYLKKLQLNAQSLNHIIARLSDVYQINTLERTIETIKVNQLIKEILKDLAFFEGFERMSFLIEVPKELEWRSDRKLLKLILLNLIENGIKFRKPDAVDKGWVRISVNPDTSNGLDVKVIDNGIGISSEDIPVVFDMFSKAALKYKNAGLGLYMVRISLKKLNGEIAVAQNGEGNTEFNVKLPFTG